MPPRDEVADARDAVRQSSARVARVKAALRGPENAEVASIVEQLGKERSDILDLALDYKMPEQFIGMAGE